MTSVKVFISHSSKTDKNDEVLSAVCEALETDFSILVDRRIRPNDEWFPCLYEYMNECHAAVILLSKAALNSDWVRAEAAILCNRRRTQQNFKFILIPLDNLKIEDLEKQSFFKAIRMLDFQAIREYQNTDDLLEQMKLALSDLTTNKPAITPFDKMTSQMQTILKLICKKSPDEFTLAFEEGLKRITPDYILEDNKFGEALVRVLFRDPLKIFINLKLLFEELFLFIGQAEAGKILDIVKGHWVHLEAAMLLHQAKTTIKPVAINGKYVNDFSGHCYARLAWPAPIPYKLVTANKNETNFSQIEETLLSEVPPKTHPHSLRLQFLESFNDPLLLIFPFPESDPVMGYPDQTLLDEINLKLKNVTVIVATGAEFPSHLHFVTPLEPMLEEQQEKNQYTYFSLVKQYVVENLSA